MKFARSLFLAMVLAAAPAWAQGPVSAVAPAGAEKPPVEEERPDFQPLRSAEPEDGAAPAVVLPLPSPAVVLPPPSPAVLPPAPAVSAPVAPPAPVPVQALPPAPAPAPAESPALWPWALAGLLLVAGAVIAGVTGALTLRGLRQAELAERRRAVAASLAAELETRRLAFDAVPLPPNVDAGVSFVSAVISMAGIDCAFRAAQGWLFLLPAPLTANVSVHYAAVQRVADFVKGQSLAAAVRMMQANRLGGHPCPDAGAMREAHVELAAAFRGLDKVVLALRSMQR